MGLLEPIDEDHDGRIIELSHLTQQSNSNERVKLPFWTEVRIGIEAAWEVLEITQGLLCILWILFEIVVSPYRLYQGLAWAGRWLRNRKASKSPQESQAVLGLDQETG
jgi:hypothetical protein